jgi:hypothetical protein
MAVSGEDAIRSYIARLLETARLKVVFIEGQGINVADGLAGYLAEDDIIALERCND